MPLITAGIKQNAALVAQRADRVEPLLLWSTYYTMWRRRTTGVVGAQQYLTQGASGLEENGKQSTSLLERGNVFYPLMCVVYDSF